MALAKNWDRLNTKEKFEARFESFMAAENIDFASNEMEARYKKAVQRLKDVVQLKKPDRIPIVPNMGFYPAEYAGITFKEAMYDYDKLGKAWLKFNIDFNFDYLTSCMLVGPGPVFEKLNLLLYKWPGHGINSHTPYQCVEKEYLKVEEYDDFINDPSGFFIKTYLPRIFGSLEPWQKLLPFTSFLEMPFISLNMVPFGRPDVQESFKKFLDAGKRTLEWFETVKDYDKSTVATLGMPQVIGGFSKAPFDTLGDTLRGTKKIMLDMYRCPEKLLKALERIVPLAIEMGVDMATKSNNPFVYIPLHKGEDSFISREQYAKFYWPSLKKVILGLVREGCVPSLFVEGSYNDRLDFLQDPELPVGKIYWFFDQTDMEEVKIHLTGKASFGGNVPPALLKIGTAAAVRDYVKELINRVAGDGGYILTTGAVIDDAKAENIKAMIEAGREYGRY